MSSITVTIGGVDRTSLVQFNSLTKSDRINSQVDTLKFNILYHAGQTFRPATNSEVIVMDGATKMFGGNITSVEAKQNGAKMIIYAVTCNDYSAQLKSLFVTEEYTSEKVEDIIADVFDNFAPTFTYTNVNCDTVLTKISFDNVYVLDVVAKLAEITGFAYYVDYNKDLHFFEKNTEVAPFNITDDNGNLITGTLQTADDLSQIRNRVYIKGSEVEGESRTEYFNGDGTKDTFVLANKFAHEPTVTLGGAAKTVGIDYLDSEDDFDCLWSFEGQYLKWKTPPTSGTNNLVVSGIPLYTLIVQVSDPDSIATYGVHEFLKIDRTIKDRSTAVGLAKAELEAYKTGLSEAFFDTYTTGLRSGQVINITSTVFGIAEDYLIQEVRFRMVSQTVFRWQVRLARLRTVKLVDFLISLLNREQKLITGQGEVVLEKTEWPQEFTIVTEAFDVQSEENPQAEAGEGSDAATVQALDYQPVWTIGVQLPSGTKRVAIVDGSFIN